MTGPVVDVVTVAHRDHNHALAVALEETLAANETVPFTFVLVDNRYHNRGFAAGCNLGAEQTSAPIILFLNPDVEVDGPLLHLLVAAFDDQAVVIAGERFGKARADTDVWGCIAWVCGACFGVRRDWFARVGGFDERYVWSFEDTDLVRQAQQAGRRVVELDLPVRHVSPDPRTDPDRFYKDLHFQEAAERFYARWPRRATRRNA